VDPSAASEIEASLPAEARVVDVGGGASPFRRADHVIDGVAYGDRGRLDSAPSRDGERFSVRTWVQLDLCGRDPWPFPDKFFDFAVCSHVLEDVRDPIWVCSELSRIARAGYIETPSRLVEQSLGVEHPGYAGFLHHRWLVSIEDGVLSFRYKPHSLHVQRDAIVAVLGPSRRLKAAHQTVSLWWTGQVRCREELCFDEDDVNRELCAFAAQGRRIADLTVPSGRPLGWVLKRHLFFHRLRRNAP
jgi:hypothetical protein